MMAYPLKLPTPVNGRDFLTIESNFAAQAVPVANVIGATRSQGIRAGLIEPVWDLTERRVPRPAMMEEASSVVEEMSG